jgi:hypothetical protein
MDMHVDQAGGHNPAAGVNNPIRRRRIVLGRGLRITSEDSSDPAILNEDVAGPLIMTRIDHLAALNPDVHILEVPKVPVRESA